MKRVKINRPTKGAFAVITTVEGARHRVVNKASEKRLERTSPADPNSKVGKSRYAATDT